ncbi:MAG: SDR family NAD(P)-dependent oxidoreductase [Chromatiales bacterium]|nr:SDR family NAD(P)-dependent oxidoreductase [Chromatiales bacterium]
MAGRESAIIVGAGLGLGAALARACHAEGMDVVLAARDVTKLAPLARDIGARTVRCDAASRDEVEALFAQADGAFGAPSLVVYNPSRRVRGSIAELDPAAVHEALMVTCFGGFLVGREAARRMLVRGSGSILFTGASASVKGYPGSAPFAMGKFALRGLAQSMARELGPRNIHVAHFVIDGGIAAPGETRPGDDRLDADAIAVTYLQVHRQHRSAWTDEVALRPWVESF